MPFLSLESVSKRFDDVTAVDRVSVAVDRGEVVGFLGPNGAGKSTTMRLITQYYEPDTGEIRLDGLPLAAAARAAKRRIGYLPENNPLYGDMLVSEYLAFIADLGTQGARPQPGHRRRRHRDRPRDRLLPAHRRAVQGLPPAGRARAGHPAPPRPARVRRAHRRTRSEPTRRDPAPDRRARQGPYGDPLHPRALRGAAHVLPAAHHQPRPDRGRRARRPAAPPGRAA